MGFYYYSSLNLKTTMAQTAAIPKNPQLLSDFLYSRSIIPP